VVFERLEQIDDLGAALCGFYRGARRLVSKRRDWLIEQVAIVPLNTIMNNGAALARRVWYRLFALLGTGWLCLDIG
jgi:hypothetical protein